MSDGGCVRAALVLLVSGSACWVVASFSHAAVALFMCSFLLSSFRVLGPPTCSRGRRRHCGRGIALTRPRLAVGHVVLSQQPVRWAPAKAGPAPGDVRLACAPQVAQAAARARVMLCRRSWRVRTVLSLFALRCWTWLRARARSTAPQLVLSRWTSRCPRVCLAFLLLLRAVATSFAHMLHTVMLV